MENIIDFILSPDFVSILLSIVATIKAFLVGKKTLTPEQIEQKGELKKQKYTNKLYKKNKINPNEVQTVSQSVETDLQTIGEISKNI